MAVIAGASGLAALVGARFEDLSRDVSAVLGGPPWTGSLSQLVGSAWFASAAIAVFAAVVLRRSGRDGARMLLTGGLLTAVMSADDLFLLHEGVFPEIGIPEVAVLGAYFVAAIVFILRFRVQLAESALLIGGALLMWVLSGVVDLVVVAGSFLLEDGAKLAGVALWSVMLVRLSSAKVAAAMTDLQRIQ
ncbi:hypothetical protein [Actinomycetospora cinnamomea]|nr:hypothetical protein [Actinomycetospora cinnamomea]